MVLISQLTSMEFTVDFHMLSILIIIGEITRELRDSKPVTTLIA